MTSTLRAAAVQLESGADVGQNLAAVRRWVGEAAARGAELVVLPENFAFFGRDTDKRAIAEDLGQGGAVIDTLRELGARHAIDLIGGGMPERSADPARPYNSSVHVGPSGEIVSVYRKLHLFDVLTATGDGYAESKGTTRGQQVVLSQVRGLSVGLSVCYDLRFSELYRAMDPAQILTVPAAFTAVTGAAHWHVLLRARAIEAQAFVIAPAQDGHNPALGRATYGHSLLIDPWGEVLAEAPAGAGVITAELDLTRLQKVRSDMPMHTHRQAFVAPENPTSR